MYDFEIGLGKDEEKMVWKFKNNLGTTKLKPTVNWKLPEHQYH